MPATFGLKLMSGFYLLTSDKKGPLTEKIIGLYANTYYNNVWKHWGKKGTNFSTLII